MQSGIPKIGELWERFKEKVGCELMGHCAPPGEGNGPPKNDMEKQIHVLKRLMDFASMVQKKVSRGEIE